MRKIVFIFFLAVLLAPVDLFSFDERGCLKLYKELEQYSDRKTIDQVVLDKSYQITNSLLDCLEADRNERSAGKETDHSIEWRMVEDLLTGVFSNICLKNASSKAVEYYTQYLMRNEDSAEEMLSYNYENLFVKNPEAVFKEIKKRSKPAQEMLLDQLLHGFISNRFYGDLSPSGQALNSGACEKLFYKINPEAKSLKKEYGEYIKHIIAGCIRNLKWEEAERAKKK